MTEMSVITEEQKAMLNVEAEPEIFEVEKGHIKRYTEAVGDFNPLYCDIEIAKKSPYKTIIAPPTLFIDAGLVKMAACLKKAKCPLKGFLNGGTEIEYYKPIKVGDIITSVAKLVDLQEKSGKSGKLLFMIVEVTYKNQKGDIVARCRDTFIRR